MHYGKKLLISPTPKVIDISEEKEGIVAEYGMKAYRKILEEQFIKFKNTKPIKEFKMQKKFRIKMSTSLSL